MRVTLETLYRSYNTIKSLADQPLEVQTLLKVRNLLIQLQAPFTQIKDFQENLLEELGANLAESVTGETQYNLDEDQYREFLDRLHPFLQSDIELEWTPISVHELAGAIISIKELSSIEFLFHDIEQATKESLRT